MANQMLYRKLPATGEKISILGYGCMRFPRKGVVIDEARTERLLASAIDYGINFYDTAHIYIGSEKALGNGLSNLGARSRVKITTKLPIMFVRNKRDIQEMFDKQLKRLKTDYVDFYLAHSLTSFADFNRLAEKGFLEFLETERARGRILNTGFSFHGNTHDFKQIIDAFPCELCMIQYNYLDEHFQAGLEGLNYAEAKGLGVVAMEPLRGGLLGGRLPRAARKLYDHYCVQTDCVNPAELALRWIWKHQGVTCLISGMGEERFVADNCRSVFALGAKADRFYQIGATIEKTTGAATNDTSGAAASGIPGAAASGIPGAAANKTPNAATGITPGAATGNTPGAATGITPGDTPGGDGSPRPIDAPDPAHGNILLSVALTDDELETIDAIRRYFDVNLRVPCTSCAYCMPCPNGVDIPTCFYWYNIRKEIFTIVHYIVATEGAVNNRPSKASLCNGCRHCEKYCPQNIEISAHMKVVAKKLEKAWMRVPVRLVLRTMSHSKRKR